MHEIQNDTTELAKITQFSIDLTKTEKILVKRRSFSPFFTLKLMCVYSIFSEYFGKIQGYFIKNIQIFNKDILS
jgi:hypothetical protein